MLHCYYIWLHFVLAFDFGVLIMHDIDIAVEKLDQIKEVSHVALTSFLIAGQSNPVGVGKKSRQEAGTGCFDWVLLIPSSFLASYCVLQKVRGICL